MSFIQALIIAILGWASSIWAPPLVGGLAGWYTLGRPLVSGMFIGLILGDVKNGIILGSAIQALYIGLVTPGGSMPPDVNFATWIGIPLALASGASPEYALTIAVPLSLIGMFAAEGTKALNLIFVHKQDAAIDSGDLEKAALMPVIGQVTNFMFRFFPILIANYVGADIIPVVLEAIPEWLGEVFQIFGRLLPLVGFMLLIQMILKKKIDLLYYVFGFILVASFGMDIIPVVIIASILAYADFKYRRGVKE